MVPIGLSPPGLRGGMRVAPLTHRASQLLVSGPGCWVQGVIARGQAKTAYDQAINIVFLAVTTLVSNLVARISCQKCLPTFVQIKKNQFTGRQTVPHMSQGIWGTGLYIGNGKTMHPAGISRLSVVKLAAPSFRIIHLAPCVGNAKIAPSTIPFDFNRFPNVHSCGKTGPCAREQYRLPRRAL